MSNGWINRAREMPPDPVSGAKIIRIDTGLNIYCERPGATPDGRFFPIWTEPVGKGPVDIVDTLGMAHMRLNSSAVGAFDYAYNDACYFWYPPAQPGAPHEIRRFCQSTFREEYVTSLENPPFGFTRNVRGFSGAASPNRDYVYYTIPVRHAVQVIRIDLRTGKCEAIFEHPEMVNPHMQVDPSGSGDILLQLNPGSSVDESGEFHCCLKRGAGATHFLIDRDGGNFRQLAIGEPITAPSSGHSCWMPGKHRIALTTGWTLNPPDKFDPDRPPDWSIDPRHPGTTLWTVGPEDDQPVPLPAPEHHFFHVSCPPGSRYAVCNSTPGRRMPSDIVIVDLETGLFMTLVSRIECLRGLKGSLFPHSLPYFTGDLKYVIYNVKEQPGLPDYEGFAVYAAKVPEGFLEGLAGE